MQTIQNVITIGEELIPVEQIAYIEAFEAPADGRFKTDKPYKGRVVLLNRENVLTEDTPQAFAQANGFRLLPEDNVATNPMISFRVRHFKPTKDFSPTKPYQPQLNWRDPDGNLRPKLLLTKPEVVLTIVSRGETEPGVERKARRPHRPGQPRAPRKRTAAPTAEA
jgi:hypothetical protein